MVDNTEPTTNTQRAALARVDAGVTAALSDAAPTARKLAEASIAPNTRAAYASALRRLDAALGGAELTDETLAAYVASLYESGRAPASGSMAVAAARFRARLADLSDPVGPATERVLAGFRREGADRGRGQAAPLTADNLAAILATAMSPRRTGRGIESAAVASRRGLEDCAIAAVLFQGGLRRSEAAELEWRDVTDASDGNGILIAVRTSKTNQDGAGADVRYVKNGSAAALRKLRASLATSPETARVFRGLRARSIGARFTAAARAAGIETRLTAHSGRVGLASELTARGASTTETMLAGNWKTARMVAHYSAGATAELGAVKRYL